MSTELIPRRFRSPTGTLLVVLSACALTGCTPPGEVDDPKTGSEMEPDFTEDFSTYLNTADLLADPRNIYFLVEDVGTARISLDTTMGVGTLTQSMKYTYPDRTGSGGSRCNDYSITRVFRFDRAGVLGGIVSEYWWEMYVQFSANFTTVAPSSWNCASNRDFKFIFGSIFGAPGRWQIKNGTFGTRWEFGPAANPEDWQTLQQDPNYNFWDGEWHRIRAHWKLGNGDGVYRLWFDDDLVLDRTDVDTQGTTTNWGMKLGANMNQGPGQEQTLHWGGIRIWTTDPGW